MISDMLDESVDVCIKAFESYFNTPIPPSLLIIGNDQVRERLQDNIKNGVKTLVCGPNGSGKNMAIRLIANKQKLNLIKSTPLKQSELVLSFGKGPLYNNNDNLYVIDANSLSKKKYSLLLKYVKEAERPIVIIADSRDKIHKRILSELEVLSFGVVSPNDVAKFLKKKYNWEGDIKDIYSDDMRIVISRVLVDEKLEKIKRKPIIPSSVFAFNISCGFTKYEDFEQLKDPIWWVIRWLGFNQWRKFLNKQDQLHNLKMLAEIDSKKFYYPPEYIKQMLININPSPRRGRFIFPPWPKKKEVKEIQFVEKLKAPRTKTKQKISVPLDQIDFSKWL
jgi:hypothetical protein